MPVLLYDGNCALCVHIANGVRKAAALPGGGTRLGVQPIGDDPEALQRVAPGLDIWEAYKTNYLIMPHGPMKRGGEAVAEIFRILPITRWFSPVFGINVFGHRPFQEALNLSYAILSDIRPLLGCGRCGAPKPWVRPIDTLLRGAKRLMGLTPPPRRPVHASPLPGRP